MIWLCLLAVAVQSGRGEKERNEKGEGRMMIKMGVRMKYAMERGLVDVIMSDKR